MSITRILKNRDKQRVLLVTVTFLLSVLLMRYYSAYERLLANTVVKYALKDATLVTNIKVPTSDEKERLLHPYLHRECYTYKNFTARFKCNNTHEYRKFSKKLIIKCASEMWKTVRNPDEVDPWDVDLNNSSRNSDCVAISKRPAVHWVFSGDSHIRNVFEVLIRRLAGPRVKYRYSSSPLKQWQDTEDMIANMGRMKHDYYQQVILLDHPLKLTHKWQPLWKSIENDLKVWLSNKEPRPAHLLFGGIMHFMIHAGKTFIAEGPEKAVQNFTNQIRRLAPLLTNFTVSTPTIYKLSDHVQVCPFNNVTNNDNIDLHNNIAKEVLAGTGVKLWDSAIPLSDINNKECRLRFKQSFKENELSDWRCNDKRHMGYLFIDQYLDMILNEMCNDVL